MPNPLVPGKLCALFVEIPLVQGGLFATLCEKIAGLKKESCNLRVDQSPKAGKNTFLLWYLLASSSLAHKNVPQIAPWSTDTMTKTCVTPSCSKF